MAIAMVLPFAGQGVVVKTSIQRQIIRQALEEFGEFCLENLGVAAFGLPPEISFEGICRLNRPH